MRKNAFSKEGTFFKGNTHVHTKHSDGIDYYEDVIDIYKKEKYNFLAITDHNHYFSDESYDEKDFIIIPGIEIDKTELKPLKIHHMVGLGIKENSNFEHNQSLEKVDSKNHEEAGHMMSKLLRDNNQLVIYAHPLWSRAEVSDFEDIEGITAIEIYNRVCDDKWRLGYSLNYWDSLLRQGKKVWGIASDDSHGGDNYAKGYIMVKAESLTQKNIFDSIKSGNFYASQGPKIHDFYIEDNKAYVECSKVKEINFVSFDWWGLSYRAKENEFLTKQTHEIYENPIYIRVEIVDEFGKKAWSNPIFL